MKSFSPILVILFSWNLLMAQVDFNETNLIDINTGLDSPTSAFAADIDGDGDLDMLATSRGDDKVVWYENLDGQGDYGVQKIISFNVEEPGHGIAHDMDGDGDLDVMVSTVATSDSRIYWYENLDGNGNFGVQQLIYDDIYIIQKIYALDIDNDGDMDIATGDTENHFWFENMNGQGTFGAKQDLTPTSNLNIQDFDFFDIDNDGDLDIVSCALNPFFNQPDEIVWFINEDGQGNFSPKQLISETVEAPTAIDATDIDGDGDLDVLTASSSNGDVAWHENADGFGMFNDKVIIDGFVNAKEVLGVDVDNDGDQDVIVGYAGGNIVLFENTDGQGDFEDTPISFMQSSAEQVMTADLDNDGDLEVYSTDVIGHRVAWYNNLGQGNFDSQQQITANVTGVIKVDCADMDNDGDLDMVSLSLDWRDNKIAWYPNIGDGEYGDQQIVFLTADLMNDFDLMDMDNDGFVDIVATKNGIGDEIFWLRNDGAGNFEHVGISSTTIARVIIGDDFTGDGNNDILRANANFVGLHVNIGNGNGWFDGDPVANSLISIESIYAADIDGDGDLDFVSAASGETTVGWHENVDGQGTFSPRQAISTEAGDVYDVYASDVDGDGDMDVLSASYGPAGKIVWYENLDGQGNFSAEKIINLNAEDARAVRTQDFDGDGDLDVVFATSNEVGGNMTDKLAWHENLDGQGNFGTENILLMNEAADGVRSIHAGDFDGDGSVDIAVAAESAHKIVLFDNDGVSNNKFTGRIRRDIDSNGCDENDPVVPNVLVGTVSSSFSSTFSLDNGFYQIFVPAGSYDLRLYQPDYYDVDPNLYSQTFSGTGTVETVDFCLTPNTTINDVSVMIAPLEEPRPGFEMSYELVYKNIGTEVLSGSASLNFDDQQLTFLNATETPTAQSNNQLTFDYTDLQPFEIRKVQLDFEVMQPPIVEAGDSLILTASIEPLAGDFTPNDNFYELKNEVINSFDPNDIIVLEGDSVSIQQVDEYLHYVIRFQNVGTASAINVEILTYLDSKLDAESLEVLSSSHFLRTEVLNTSNYNFIFENINLSDSTSNEPASHGFLVYRIKMKSFAIDPGDVINNSAAIYFDFNSPIFTNTVFTTIFGEQDSEPPTAICADVTLGLDETGNRDLWTSMIDNGSTDNIGIENYALSQSAFSCDDIGETTVTLTVTDAAGNTSNCTGIVTILDDDDPNVVTQDITVDLNGNPSVVVAPEQIDNGSTDNCAIEFLELSETTYTNPATTSVVLTATDFSGNSSFASAFITIINTVSTEDLERYVTIAPNPVLDELQIDLENYELESVVLYSLLGEVLLEKNETVFDISELVSGVYVVMVKVTSGESVLRKIVKL